MFRSFKKPRVDEAPPAPDLVLPSVPAGRVVVPRSVLSATFRAFVPYWQAEVETAVFWAGPDTEGQGVVTTLVQPALLQTSGNYLVPPASRQDLSRALRARHLVIHAQVHTHPGLWVGHSRYDDHHAYSTAEGSLSLVWPRYGAATTHDLKGVGIHLRQRGAWVEAKTPEAWNAHLQIVDDHLDLRFAIQAGGLHDEE